MKRLLSIYCLLVFGIHTNGQIEDYRAVRDSVYIQQCGSISRGVVRQNLLSLEGLAVDSKTFGADSYHYDLGMCYYLLSVNEDFDEHGLRKSVSHYVKAIAINKKHSSAYWNIAFVYGYLDECENALKYLSLYKKHTKKKHLKYSKDQIESLEKKCSK